MADIDIQEMYRQISMQLNQVLSAVQTTAIGTRRLQPRAECVTGPSSATIPSGCKAFNIINLGRYGTNASFADIQVTGITGIDKIVSPIRVFGYTIENDLDLLEGQVTVTPDVDHVILIQYLTTWH